MPKVPHMIKVNGHLYVKADEGKAPELFDQNYRKLSKAFGGSLRKNMLRSVNAIKDLDMQIESMIEAMNQALQDGTIVRRSPEHRHAAVEIGMLVNALNAAAATAEEISNLRWGSR